MLFQKALRLHVQFELTSCNDSVRFFLTFEPKNFSVNASNIFDLYVSAFSNYCAITAFDQ